MCCYKYQNIQNWKREAFDVSMTQVVLWGGQPCGLSSCFSWVTSWLTSLATCREISAGKVWDAKYTKYKIFPSASIHSYFGQINEKNTNLYYKSEYLILIFVFNMFNSKCVLYFQMHLA